MHISGVRIRSSLHRTEKYASAPVLSFHTKLHYSIKIAGLPSMESCELKNANSKLKVGI